MLTAEPLSPRTTAPRPIISSSHPESGKGDLARCLEQRLQWRRTVWASAFGAVLRTGEPLVVQMPVAWGPYSYRSTLSPQPQNTGGEAAREDE